MASSKMSLGQDQIVLKTFANQLSAEKQKVMGKIANTIRILSMDAVQKADSGHPGLPLGCAEIGAYLYAEALRHHPKNPKWTNRDRFVLSAGHGSMLLYSCLHLAGFNLSLDDLINFRQLHSKTPGHPECFVTEGVETTTGPLGQGLGNGVGMALGMKILAAKFNTEQHQIIDNKIFVLLSDGCMMEGATSEVSSLAGHWKLDNLIVIYDANQITLDGNLSDTFSENVKQRYLSYGWDVFETDGYDLENLHSIIEGQRENQTKPCLIIANTVIAKGSCNKEGTHKAHGSPLGQDEIKATKNALGLSDEPFYVEKEVRDFFSKKLKGDAQLEKEWNSLFKAWGDANPKLLQEFNAMNTQQLPEDLETSLKSLPIKTPIATRSASQEVINFITDFTPYLYGGSADLSSSDMTMLKKFPLLSSESYTGRNIRYGVREFGMATIATGLVKTGMIRPFIGTFLTFSDYMKNAIRLCSLMQEQVIYQFTHDSIFLGEDGPTHQPIEHVAGLRAIPGLQVIRPANAHETKMAWIAALQYKGPTALILSRQALPELPETHRSYSAGVGKGAYIVKQSSQTGKRTDYLLVATGSELALALEVATALEKLNKTVRVVSMPCWEIFEKQSSDYQDSIFGGEIGKRVSIEAGVSQGWHKFIGRDGIAICMDQFGTSAPIKDLMKEFGFNVDAILKRIL